MEYFELDGKRFVLETPRQYWRVNHDITYWRPNLPEVFPFEPSHYSPFGRSWQLLEKSLNPKMVNSKWRNAHLGGNLGNKATAFNNRQGFEMVGDPRADFINGRDLTSPIPKQEDLVCGGAILLERKVDNEFLYPYYIDTNQPTPTLAFVKANPHLYFDAVTIDKDILGRIVIRRFPQGDGERVFTLLLANREIRIPLNKVSKLPLNSVFPSPYLYP